MGGGQQVTQQTSSTAPANPNVTKTVDQVLGSLQTELGKDPQVFDQSLASGAGGVTQQGWQSALTAANNPNFTSAINGAITDFGDIAAGNRYGTNDPGYATVRQNAIDDTMSNVNSVFNNSGRFGGGSHVQKLGEGVSNTIAGLDYGNLQNDRAWQAQALQLLPGAFQSSLLPSSAITAVGGAQDANTQALLLGQNDLFRRKADAKLNQLGLGTSIVSGNAGASGTNTVATQSQPQTPLWQSLLGGTIGALSFL